MGRTVLSFLSLAFSFSIWCLYARVTEGSSYSAIASDLALYHDFEPSTVVTSSNNMTQEELTWQPEWKDIGKDCYKMLNRRWSNSSTDWNRFDWREVCSKEVRRKREGNEGRLVRFVENYEDWKWKKVLKLTLDTYRCGFSGNRYGLSKLQALWSMQVLTVFCTFSSIAQSIVVDEFLKSMANNFHDFNNHITIDISILPPTFLFLFKIIFREKHSKFPHTHTHPLLKPHTTYTNIHSTV